ncbi:MAG: DNA recombination protein RmuC [bacterium]|nr:DNA recombination protein RmuC [bacterium]
MTSSIPLLPGLGLLLIGAGLGVLLGYYLGRKYGAAGAGVAGRLAVAEAAAETETQRRRELDSELDAAQETVRDLDRQLAVATERGRLFEAAKQEFEKAFEALAHRAMTSNIEEFLTLAGQRLETARAESGKDLDERRRSIEDLVKPLGESLQRLDQRTVELERARTEAYSRLDQQMRQLALVTEGLQERTTSLASALRGSEVRGRWGEVALKNVAELAGMSKHCDFVEQETLSDGSRPDMVVRLPGGRRIAVDAKAPLNAYLEAQEATAPQAREAALDRHAKAVRDHVKTLAARAYAESLEGDLDMVVLFLPGDPFLAAAFERDPNLQVDSLRQKVLLATPTTLVALLRTVAIYWQQSSMVENAEAIAAAARELYERAAKFGTDLSDMGRGLATALNAYNRAVGSYDRRLMPMGRRLEEMMVTLQTKRDLKAPAGIEGTVRQSTEATAGRDIADPPENGRLFPDAPHREN